MAGSFFSDATFDFLESLEENNRKEWFADHVSDFERTVRDPAESLVLTLGEALASHYPDLRFDTRRNGAGSLMRIHRDVRFSPDKRPYKQNLGVIWWFGEGRKVESPCFYLHIAPNERFFYAGQHGFPKAVLGTYRDAVNHEQRGQDLATTLEALAAGGLAFYEEPHWKRVPRGFDADHPRAFYLRCAGCGVAAPLSRDQLVSPDLPVQLVQIALRARPLMDWLLALQ